MSYNKPDNRELYLVLDVCSDASDDEIKANTGYRASNIN